MVARFLPNRQNSMLSCMTPLHRRLRQAARATGLDLNSLARQAEVSRAQMAAVLCGSPNATFDAVSAVAVRLGFCVSVEQQEPAPTFLARLKPWLTGLVEALP